VTKAHLIRHTRDFKASGEDMVGQRHMLAGLLLWAALSSTASGGARVTDSSAPATPPSAETLSALDRFDPFNPKNQDQDLVRVEALITAGQLPEALAIMDQKIAREPSGLVAYSKRGSLHAQMSHHQLAISDFDRVLALQGADKPWEQAIRANRGRSLAALGRDDEEIADLTVSLQSSPAWQVHLERGRAYARKGDTSRAAQDASSATRYASFNPEPWAAIATLRFAIGQNELGCEDATTACDFGECQPLDQAVAAGVCR
jgi:tetratricopeptide (TPR) repeat protein